MEQRVSAGLRLVIIGCLGALGALSPGAAAAQQGTPIAPPPAEGDYYVPPGYSDEPPPPAQTYPAPAQPYPAPQQAQPYPQQQPYAQPYPGQPYAQPYADPNAQPYQGRRRLERLGPSDPVPPGVEVIERRKLVLSFVGAGIFAGFYAAPIAIAIDLDLDSRRTLIPVIGPLLEHGHDDYLFTHWGLAVLDAGAQAVGLTLLALGLRKQRYAVYYVETGRGRTLAFTPGAGPRGLSLHMAF